MFDILREGTFHTVRHTRLDWITTITRPFESSVQESDFIPKRMVVPCLHVYTVYMVTVYVFVRYENLDPVQLPR